MSESKFETKEMVERANKYEENELEMEDLQVIESYFRDQHLKMYKTLSLIIILQIIKYKKQLICQLAYSFRK